MRRSMILRIIYNDFPHSYTINTVELSMLYHVKPQTTCFWSCLQSLWTLGIGMPCLVFSCRHFQLYWPLAKLRVFRALRGLGIHHRLLEEHKQQKSHQKASRPHQREGLAPIAGARQNSLVKSREDEVWYGLIGVDGTWPHFRDFCCFLMFFPLWVGIQRSQWNWTVAR